MHPCGGLQAAPRGSLDKPAEPHRMTTTTFLFLQVALVLVAWFIMSRRGSQPLKRLQRYVIRSKDLAGKGGKPTLYQTLDIKMERTPVFKTLFNSIESLLTMANIPVKTSEFLVAVLILMVTALVVQFLIIGFSYTSPMVLIGALILSFGFLKVYIGIRLGKIRGQLKLSISMLANNLKAGNSFIQGLRQVTTDVDPPLKGEFELLLSENQLGIPLDAALNNMLKRVPCKELETLVRGVILQQQTGANLVYILTTIYQTLQDRDDLRSKINILTIQGKLSGCLCVAIPFLLFWFMHASTPDYTGVMLHTPMGRSMLMLCGFLIFLGSYFIFRIVQFKY